MNVKKIPVRQLTILISILLAIISSAEAQELSFLKFNSPLKAQLLKWEHEAPEKVKIEIKRL